MTEFKKWLRQAYREPHTTFTEHNMEVAYLAGQASAEERVKELEQERDEAVRQWERFERMAGDNWAALKAQAGEPVAWQHRQRGLKEYEWQEWQTVGYKPQGPESQTFQMRPLFTHPTTERPYNPLNDYAVIPMNPTEPVKAQAGEPDFYVRRRPSPGYEVVSSSDPMAQPAYLHPTTERRVIPEELITRIKQTANRWANRSYDCGNRDGMGYQSSTPAKLMDQSRDDFNELIEELRNALNAAPKEMK